MPLNADQKSVSVVFDTKLRYDVPDYQRSYAWRRDNVRDLLDDLWESFILKEEEYFLGPIILVTESGDLRSLVDGQQRMTTTALILARIAHGQTNPVTNLLLLQRPLDFNLTLNNGIVNIAAQQPRVRVRDDELPFYAHLLRGGSSRGPGWDETPSTKLLAIAAEAVDSWLSERSPEDLLQFANHILGNAVFVVIQADRLNAAFRLFNVINSRGVPLSNADLLKGHLYSLAKNDGSTDSLMQAWDSFESLAAGRVDSILNHARRLWVAGGKRGAIYELFENHIKDEKISAVAFMAKLVALARNHRNIRENSFRREPILCRAVDRLLRIEFEDWMPPMLHFLLGKQEMSKSEFADLLGRLGMQLWVRGTGQAERTRAFGIILSKLRDSSAGADALRQAFSSLGNDAVFKQMLLGDVYKAPYATALLTGLDEFFSDDDEHRQLPANVTIEHVLPVTISPKGRAVDYWDKRFKYEDHLSLVHTLGNLTLLTGRRNSRSQCRSFPDKQNHYVDRGADTFSLTSRISKFTGDWTPEVISSRSERMAELALHVWGLQGTRSHKSDAIEVFDKRL